MEELEEEIEVSTSEQVKKEKLSAEDGAKPLELHLELSIGDMKR